MKQTTQTLELLERMEKKAKENIEVANFLSLCYEKVRDSETAFHPTVLDDYLVLKHEGMRTLNVVSYLKKVEHTHNSKSG